MKGVTVVFAAAAVLLSGLLVLQPAYSQFQQGGVDHPGSWYVGEGLEHGDLFSYQLCFEAYEECKNFQMDIWIEGDIQVNSETKWLAQVVVYDGPKIVKGNMELGKVAPQPTGGSPDLTTYRSAFKSSIVWLSAFADAHQPKQFSAVSWGKIGNIGGEQILPMEILPDGLTVQAGHFDEVIQIGWRTGGYTSKVYVVDGLPFPIQAATWQHVSEGIPPPEYRFELLDYEKGVTEDPFADVVPTPPEETKECPSTDNLDLLAQKTTQDGKYLLHVFYAPERPVNGCPMTWQINFLNKFDATEFHNLVQYDLLVVDEEIRPIRSIAQEKGQQHLYSPSGLAKFDITVNEEPGTARYAIWIYGLEPLNIAPSPAEADYLLLEMSVEAGSESVEPPTETDMDTGTETDMDTGTETDMDTGTETDMDTGTETDIDTGTTPPPPTGPSGCLIATAAYGTELAPQVQLLREVRDDTLLSTASGTAFMAGFNDLYYAFSPAVADMERESPILREAVRLLITPMLATLSIMTLAEEGSELHVLALGVGVISLNLAMYIAAPAILGLQIHRYLETRSRSRHRLARLHG